MYVTEQMVDQVIDRYGSPEKASFRVTTENSEFDFIRSTQKHGRSHDFTLYIIRNDKFVVIAKHAYPANLFRAPSGGLKPGEDIESGMAREAFEETGCTIELRKFLLRAQVVFECGLDSIKWTSHVFLADCVDCNMSFTDTREIREVSLASLTELDQYAHVMRDSDIAGFRYRGWLHEQVRSLL